jgi:phosphatidate cytidylyltransferase
MSRLSPLMIRILSGSLFLGLVLVLVYVGSIGVYIVATALTAGALWEFRGLSDKMGFRAPSWLIYPLGAFFALSGTWLRLIDVKLVMSLVLVAGLGAFLFIPGRREGLGRWAMGMAGAIYVGMPINYYLLLYGSRNGLAWLLFVILAAVVSDVAALLVGMRLGRTSFFKEISPKKTLEGAIAGVLGALAVVLFGNAVTLHVPLLHAVVIGALIGVAAEMGDLVESQMKRIACVKDSSNLIPGHGGVLDRLDSIFFPPILVWTYTLLFGLLK